MLEAMRGGDERAEGRLFEMTYRELGRLAGFLMAREPPGQTLQATALVNEAYLKLVGGEPVNWTNRRHFIWDNPIHVGGRSSTCATSRG